jgi:hypothetical protein
MTKPFMIRFPLNGKDCYANVYTHEAHIREFHVQIIGPETHDGIPSRIILLAVNGRLLLSEPLDLSQAVLQLVIEGIAKSL